MTAGIDRLSRAYQVRPPRSGGVGRAGECVKDQYQVVTPGVELAIEVIHLLRLGKDAAALESKIRCAMCTQDTGVCAARCCAQKEGWFHDGFLRSGLRKAARESEKTERPDR